LGTTSESEQSSESKKNSDDEYDIRYKEMKDLENEAAMELINV
jgi:hypothetical protein